MLTTEFESYAVYSLFDDGIEIFEGMSSDKEGANELREEAICRNCTNNLWNETVVRLETFYGD